MSRLVTRAEKHRQITGTTICQECRKPWPCDYEKGRADERQRIVKAVEVWAARSAYGLKSWDGLFAVIEGGMAPQPRDEGRNTG
jgi:hypothetical protein